MKAGDSVRCIDARGSGFMLLTGRIYTVAAVGDHDCIYLDGVPVLYPGFWKRRFRRIVRTDISIFTALLTQTEETMNGQKTAYKV